MAIPSKKFQANADCIRWCTPSLLPEIVQQFDITYEGSISIAKHGKLQDNTGVFEEMHSLAAEAYKNHGGHSHFGCEGSTGANRVLFDLLSRILPVRKRVLSARNVHQSIVTNATKNRVPIDYLPTRFDKDTGLFLPPTVEDVMEDITSDTGVVLLSNPTYEGYSCDLKAIIDTVRSANESAIVYVDEAWGAHLAFSDKLPLSATEAGADLVVQSIHKQGGAPNPSNITHLSKRMTEYLDEFLQSYGDNTSTTYSYPLLNAMDTTRAIMQQQGITRLSHLITLSNILGREAQKIEGISLISPDNVHSYDPTKVNLCVAETGLTGDYIAQELERRYGIITEKEESSSLCFLSTLSTIEDHIWITLHALEEIVKRGAGEQREEISYAGLPARIEKRYEPWEAAKVEKEQVNLFKSEGRVLGENIKCYPPGIYVGQIGEVINADLIDYLRDQRGRSHIYAHDKKLEHITVLK